MNILQFDILPTEKADTPVSPLNAVWVGSIQHTQVLPQMGHLFIICPLDESKILCTNSIIDSNHYFLFTSSPNEKQAILKNPDHENEALTLVLMLSPGFIAPLAEFLNIPNDLQHLLYGIPLLNGDMLSRLLKNLIISMHKDEEIEEVFMDIIGQILQLMRLRYHALQNLKGHKENTLQDLLFDLLQARQFIEARFLEPIKTVDVATHVALSEYHFARLFKTAFNITVHQYVIQLRLKYARELLEVSHKSVTDIALDVGYNSLSAFINAFQKHTHMPPSDFRAKFQP